MFYLFWDLFILTGYEDARQAVADYTTIPEALVTSKVSKAFDFVSSCLKVLGNFTLWHTMIFPRKHLEFNEHMRKYHFALEQMKKAIK